MKTKSYLINYACVLIIALLSTPAFGQDDNDLAKIKFFEAGNYNFDFTAGSLALFGPGSAGLQTSVAPIYPGPGRHLHNPAISAMCPRPLLVIDYNPNLVLDMASMFDLDSELNESIDESMEDHMEDDGVLTDASSAANLAHAGGIHSAALVIPMGYYSIAFGVDRAFNMDFKMMGTGIKAWADIEKEVGDDVEIVRMRTDIDITARFRMDMQRYSFAISNHPLPNLWTGIGVDWLACRGRVTGLVDIEGLMATGGREFIFGDPNDPWESSLDQSVMGDYKGNTWTLRLGGGWHPLRRLAVGANISLGHKLSMKGDTELVLHRLVAYDDDDGLDPENLSLSSPTETENIESPVDNELGIEFPSSMALGLALFTGPLTTTLDYQGFWGNFSLDYLDAHFELNPNHMLKLGLYTSHFSLSLGGILCSPEFVSDDEDWDGSLLPIPLLAIGGGGNLTSHLKVDVVTQIAPAPALKLSTEIQF
ncbi:MAG: hypothetical protein GY835_21415 [bacterium]|nr:hypothetical protein [bacterium]